MNSPLKRGHVCSYVDRRGDLVDCVVGRVRAITRGRHDGSHEYTLAPLHSKSQAYSIKIVGESLIGQPSRRYTDVEIKNALSKRNEKEITLREQKRQRAEHGASAISLNKIKPGDRVLIKYRDGDRWETVSGVNLKTGKVGIAQPQRPTKFDLLEFVANKPSRPRTRWIPAELIKVKKG